MAETPKTPLNVLMIGTGEYTTGYVHGKASDSDKSAGVVALTCIDLRSQGKVSNLALCGTNGEKFAGIRSHMQRAIGDAYQGMDLTMDTFPEDGVRDPAAYEAALKDWAKPGDAVTIFTPDDTHFDIAMAAVKRGCHVLVTKPAVQKLEHHRALAEAAKEAGVLVAIEVHKRFDPIYTDARDKIQALGGFSYMYAYMSQPKHQLDTFRAWAGKSSDISYYLNSHHIDFSEWALEKTALPVIVCGAASTGVADARFGRPCEDTITLTVTWKNHADGSTGHALYTSSWVAPKADVHSQQRFFYMGQKGEINVDQAHRGYNMADDAEGYRSVNPLFMKYTPTDGKFSGQNGYGCRSIAEFIKAAQSITDGDKKAEDFDASLPTIGTTYLTTAILEAGRLSLDNGGHQFEIKYEDTENPHIPTSIEPLAASTVQAKKQKV